MIETILMATLDTCLMVVVSCFFGIVFGGALGVFLFITSTTLNPSRCLNFFLESFVNIARSLPYIILMVSIIPLTRFLTGSSIGLFAAIVPLSLAAIFLWARSVQDALNNLPISFTEMGVVMGLKTKDVITKILLPEAKPDLIRQSSLLSIQIVGFSAMAGAVGGGGLGDVAIRHGYQRYDTQTMIIVIAILVALVQVIQTSTNLWIKSCRQN